MISHSLPQSSRVVYGRLSYDLNLGMAFKTIHQEMQWIVGSPFSI